MPETDICHVVKEKYPDYEGLLACAKSTTGPTMILSDSKTKKGRPRVMVIELPVDNGQTDSEMEFVTEVSILNNQAFKFRISDRSFMKPPLIRYDSKGIAHKNPAKNQRLSEQKIGTPHFQKFDNDGELFAYKTEKLKTPEGERELSNVVYCVMHFYEEANMDHDGDLPSLSIEPSGGPLLFPTLPQQIDPNSHVHYFA